MWSRIAKKQIFLTLASRVSSRIMMLQHDADYCVVPPSADSNNTQYHWNNQLAHSAVVCCRSVGWGVQSSTNRGVSVEEVRRKNLKWRGSREADLSTSQEGAISFSADSCYCNRSVRVIPRPSQDRHYRHWQQNFRSSALYQCRRTLDKIPLIKNILTPTLL